MDELMTKVSLCRLIFRFFRYHWRGLVSVITPIVAVYNYYPATSNYDNVAMCGIIMIVYWVTECIPLQVTSFIPVALMPITRTMDTHPVCMCYLDDTIILYMAGIMLGSAVEFSGLARRIALKSFNCFGVSHCKLLFTVFFTTSFISMWITNTAATLIMIPIVQSILEIYELQGELKVNELKRNGDLVPSSLTICYYCSISFAATIGGIGTLFGTATNFVGKALFKSEYPEAPQLLTIHQFSFFSLPIMLALNICTYLYMAIMYLGMFRPFSKARYEAKLTEDAMQHGRQLIKRNLKELGPTTCYEYIVMAMIFLSMAFLCLRSPGYFTGWGDYIQTSLKLKGNPYVLDSVAAIFICFVMIMLPCPKKCRELCKRRRETGSQEKFRNEMLERRMGRQSRLLVTWDHMSGQLPWSYMFVLGGALALATSCRGEYSNTQEEMEKKIEKLLENLDSGSRTNSVLIPIVIAVTVFATNFISNMIVAILGVLYVINMAFVVNTNPLWYVIAVNFAASFCFMLPMGTPGNHIVYKTANMPILSMIFAGLGPTIFSIVFMWLAVTYYAPIIWPILKEEGVPAWVNRTGLYRTT